MEAEPVPLRPLRGTALRILGAIGAALVIALGAYWLLELFQPGGGLVSVSFLLILPAAVCGLAAFLADPAGDRRRRFHVGVALWIIGAALLASMVLLNEGRVCIVLLSPLWMIMGVAGSVGTHKVRRHLRGGRNHCVALAVLPLLAMQLEPMLPVPAARYTVTRDIVIEAQPEAIWPLLRGIPDVRPGEGRWNLSQDLLSVPRPRGATLVGEGVGAERLATWDHQIRFAEQITEWHPGRRIGWRFRFDDMRGWAFTDRHLLPDSPYFRVETGGYTLTPLAGGRTRVALDTSYWVQTPVNGYSSLWGELFLGDLENNLLVLVKQRAERR